MRTLNPNRLYGSDLIKENLSLKQREHLSQYYCGGDVPSSRHRPTSYRSSPAMATQSTLQYVL